MRGAACTGVGPSTVQPRASLRRGTQCHPNLKQDTLKLRPLPRDQRLGGTGTRALFEPMPAWSMQHPVLWAMMRQARQARQAMMEQGAGQVGLVLAVPRSAHAHAKTAKQGFPVWLAPRWLARRGTNPRLGTACRSRAVTDPSRIVFGISPPPHARAPIARALIIHGFRWNACTSSQPNQASLAQARFAHLLLATPRLFFPSPPGGLQEQLMAIDQHKKKSAGKDWPHFICTSS